MVVIKLKDSSFTKIEVAKRGMSFRQFAESVGISHSYLSQVMNKKRNPSARVALKISQSLDFEMQDIFLITNVAKDNPPEYIKN